MYFAWIARILLISLLAAALLLGVQLFLMWKYDQETTISFLAVGQGDAILIQSGHEQVLIDGGRDGSVLLAALGEKIPFYDRTIEVVIATHPDADHIGGFPMLFERYQIGQFIETGFSQIETTEKTTDDLILLRRALERFGIQRDIPGRAGVILHLRHGGSLEILYPRKLPLARDLSSNEGSIVTRFTFGKTDFLFTGDLPHEEEFLPMVQPVEVLKAAHHGSASSTSDAWLDLVRPKEVILSVGENNYGHPASQVLERFAQRQITSLRTDEDGSITYVCMVDQESCVREVE